MEENTVNFWNVAVFIQQKGQQTRRKRSDELEVWKDRLQLPTESPSVTTPHYNHNIPLLEAIVAQMNLNCILLGGTV